MSVEMVVCGVCLVRKCVHEYICVCVSLSVSVFLHVSLCALIFVLMWTHLCVWVRDQMFAWSISGVVEEQRTLGYARPEGILLRAEWN